MSDIYLSITETPTVVTLSQPVIGSSVAATVTVGNTVTVALDANSLSALEQVTVTVGAAVSVSNFPASQVVTGSVAVTTMPAISISSVSISNFPATQAVSGTVTANTGLTQPLTDAQLRASAVTVALDSTSLNALENVTVTVGAAVTIAGFSTSSLPPSTVTVGNSVTIGNFPSTQTIAGTVTANLSKLASHASTITKADNQIQIIGGYSGGSLSNATAYPIAIESTGYINSNLRWGGTGVLVDTGASALPVQVVSQASVTIGSLPAISGTVTANSTLQNSNSVARDFIDESISYSAFSVVLSGSDVDIPVIGAVTAAAPNGSLTTRFGTPTTANTAFATSAVTNASRKYLLIQNVTTGSNVITVGIGFTPTTTQGIQLTAGAGITFESSYIPTGAIYILSSVTASNFTILEA